MFRTFNNYKRYNMLLIIFWALIIAVVAYVYREFLAYEPVLNWWFKFGLRFENRWFYKPIWGCQMCFAGQLALWIYVFNWISSNFENKAPFWRFVFFLIPNYGNQDFSVFSGVFSISMSILFTIIITNSIKK